MSMGPTTKEKTELSRFDRVRFQAKRTAEEYFKNPLHYLFYGSLCLTMLGLFIGLNFAWQYYVILSILAAIKLFNYFNAK